MKDKSTLRGFGARTRLLSTTRQMLSTTLQGHYSTGLLLRRVMNTIWGFEPEIPYIHVHPWGRSGEECWHILVLRGKSPFTHRDHTISKFHMWRHAWTNEVESSEKNQDNTQSRWLTHNPTTRPTSTWDSLPGFLTNGETKWGGGVLPLCPNDQIWK